ncbi:Uncharacterised protein [uncultured Ruminococcus sp.]|uniref:hypothetical protein n=1 Tax=Huintestinicola butyrica TaxID=2981728 RepID=UPI000821B76F|nr:hypothetical protein [Huintestinicola butyrica]MCU6727696.1 hypothetical protein [Huintestinicola butyrica]SCI90793.1 Uncharacterised protein [uncultured Ruminococcus sp.]
MEFNAINGVILIEEVCKFPMALLIVAMVIVCFGFFVAQAQLIKCDSEKGPSCLNLIVLIIITGIVAFIPYEINDDPLNLGKPTGEYKVITTQEVSMTEFQDTYEIVDYKDGVYTVRMKGEQ